MSYKQVGSSRNIKNKYPRGRRVLLRLLSSHRFAALAAIPLLTLCFVVSIIPTSAQRGGKPAETTLAVGDDEVVLASINGAHSGSGDGESHGTAISADGRFVVFGSNAPDIVAGQTDTNNAFDVFVYDRMNNITSLVSHKNGSSSSANGNSGVFVFPFNTSISLSISADGRYVVYTSAAADIVADDTNGTTDVFIYDRFDGSNRLVSFANNNNGSGNGSSSGGLISADGKVVCFSSNATNISATNDTNGFTDIYARSLDTGVTKLVSISMAGANGGNGRSSFGSPRSISADGRFVVFESEASDLVSNDTNGSGVFNSDVFVRDLQTGTTTLVTVNTAGNGSGNLGSFASSASISGNGRYVVFASDATNFVSGITDAGHRDIFRRDLVAGTTSMVSVNVSNARSGNDDSQYSAVSNDGRYVAFSSSAGDLVPQDTNNGLPSNIGDAFVRDMQSGQTELVSVNNTNTDSGNSDSGDPVAISGDGRRVLFKSAATNLSDTPDFDNNPDLFVRDLLTHSTKVASIRRFGGAAGATLYEYALSSDGLVVSFSSHSSSIVTNDDNAEPDVFTFGPSFQPNVTVNDVVITEGDSGTTNAVFTVNLSYASSQTITVNFATTDVTAHAAAPDSDYVSNSGTLTFLPGVTSQQISVAVLGDTTIEPNESFLVNLSVPVNATIADSLAIGRINNDDAVGGNFAFSSSSYSVSETAGSILIVVNRNANTSTPATVDYATSDDSADSRHDYTTARGTLRFEPGETSKAFPVLVNLDAFNEASETVGLTLSRPTGGAILGSPAVAFLSIDNAPWTPPPANPIDEVQFFVRQHYHDFLNREPDSSGLDFWTHEITQCGSDPICLQVKRNNVSAAFFLSIEFQGTGYLVERLYKVAYGDAAGTSTLGSTHQLPVPIIRFSEFLPDSQEIARGLVVGAPGWEQVLENNKVAFAQAFVQRSRFTSAFTASSTPAQFVDALFAHAGITPTTAERDTAINEFSGAPTSNDNPARARALRRVAENSRLDQNEKRRAFVLMQYFGYLRRNPDDPQDTNYTGYDFWLTKLNEHNGNYIEAEMVKAFLDSSEYRARFGP